MKKNLFAVQSLRNGRRYHVSASGVDDFYLAEVLGRHRNVLDRAIRSSRRGLSHFTCGFGLVGTVMLQLFNAGGDLIGVQMGGNLVVNTGKNAVIDRLQGTSVGVHDFQALGTGTTAAAAGDTTLETELTGGSNARVQGTLSQPAATTDRLVSTFGAGNGTGAVTETGRLTASSGGNLFARQVFSVINKAADDSLQTTHDITIS